MRFRDANVFLRHITGDDPVKAAACRTLFLRLERGEDESTICEAIITEVVYVLAARAHYGQSAAAIRASRKPLLPSPGLKLPRKHLYHRALDLYASHPFLDFEDAIVIAHLEDADPMDLVSYDRGFDRLPQVKRVEPSIETDGGSSDARA